MKKLLLSLAAIMTIPLWLPLVLRLFGYFTYTTGWKAAEYIVERNEGVEKCKKVIVMPWEVFSPGGIDQRMDCIHTYAKLTKDPSACELLMPSSYGWSCLGAAEESNARMCWFDFTKELYSNSKPVMPECGGKNDTFSRRCCEMAKFLYVEKASNCEEFNDSTPLHDQCLELVARRARDIGTCSLIQSDHIRTACEVAVRALQKSSSI